MKKETMDFLESCKKEGIIDEYQINRAMALDKVAMDKRDLTRRNFLNLSVALMSVFLILVGVMVVYQKYNFVNPTIKLLTSGVLVVISLLGMARSKTNKNYFYLELFVAINLCAILMFIMSANMETVFRYRASTNSFLTALAMLPVFFIFETYITLIVYSFGFLTSLDPELNLVFFPIPDQAFELIIIALYVGLLIYKFIKLYKNRDNVTIYSKFFKNDVVLMFLEILIVLYIFRFCYTSSNSVEIAFVYIIMLWILVRRTTLFKGLTPLPISVDIIVYFGVIYLFVFNQAKTYNPTVVLTYHTLYYMVILLLRQKEYLEHTLGLYRIQQYFYINLFMFVFAIDRVITTNNIWFVVTIILGMFNAFIGIRFKSELHSIIGLGIIITTLVFTALKVPSTIGGVMFAVTGIIIVFANRKMLREVLKGYE